MVSRCRFFFEPPLLIFVRSLCAKVFLEFSEGEFIDTIPTEIGLLTDLQFLNLAHNAFSGTVPTEVGHLQRLRTLNMLSLFALFTFEL